MLLQPQVIAPSSRPRTVVRAALALAIVVGVGTVPRLARYRSGVTRADIAGIAVRDYALDAFPQWRADHPWRACPASLAELNPYLDARDTRDPWGEPYRFACEHGALFVVSSGEDGKPGTDDDIRSDR